MSNRVPFPATTKNQTTTNHRNSLDEEPDGTWASEHLICAKPSRNYLAWKTTNKWRAVRHRTTNEEARPAKSLPTPQVTPPTHRIWEERKDGITINWVHQVSGDKMDKGIKQWSVRTEIISQEVHEEDHPHAMSRANQKSTKQSLKTSPRKQQLETDGA